MKKLFLATLVATVLLYSAFANAEKQRFFGNDKAKCENSLPTKDFTSYEPKYFGLKGKNPVNGTTIVAAPTERDLCAHMLTTAGWQWVGQEIGTVLRWEAKDGVLIRPIARDDCGNPIDGISYGPPATPTSQPAQKLAQNMTQSQVVTQPASTTPTVIMVNVPAQQPAPATQPQQYEDPCARHGVGVDVGPFGFIGFTAGPICNPPSYSGSVYYPGNGPVYYPTESGRGGRGGRVVINNNFNNGGQRGGNRGGGGGHRGGGVGPGANTIGGR